MKTFCQVNPTFWLIVVLCASTVAKVLSADLKITNTVDGVVLDVTVYFGDLCGEQRTVEWQLVPDVQGTNIIINVRKTERRRMGGVCAAMLVPYSHQYRLQIAVGVYNLVVHEFNTQILVIQEGWEMVKTWHQEHSMSFRVDPLPLEVRIRVSEVETCWQSSRGQWYRLEYRSSMTTNNWLPVSPWLPGTGGELCVKDLVPKTGESQRYYRVASTNSVPQ